MNLKLTKIGTKSFIMIFATINVAAGLILGAIVTIVSVLAPEEQGAGPVGPWAILIFPILNGILGAVTGLFLTWMFNVLAKRFGGLELEFENAE